MTDETGDFFMITPMDTSKATVSTSVRMCYDNNNLYLLAICYKKLSGALYGGIPSAGF